METEGDIAILGEAENMGAAFRKFWFGRKEVLDADAGVMCCDTEYGVANTSVCPSKADIFGNVEYCPDRFESGGRIGSVLAAAA